MEIALNKICSESDTNGSFVASFLGGRKARGTYMGRGLAASTLVNSDSIIHILNQITAMERLLVLTIELKEFARKNGDFPNTLDRLKLPDGTSSIDPFNDKPFVYRKTTDGFVLYSVGLNGVDDGGVDDGSRKDDIAVRISIQSPFASRK